MGRLRTKESIRAVYPCVRVTVGADSYMFADMADEVHRLTIGPIVAIRTFLSMALQGSQVELEGRWPWQRRLAQPATQASEKSP
jgi:hypothetical protein